MSAEEHHACVKLTLADFAGRGWHPEICFINPDETAGSPGERCLAGDSLGLRSDWRWCRPIPESAGSVFSGAGHSLHTHLRHTCLTRWANAGMDPLNLQYLAVHKNITTMQYIHLARTDAPEQATRDSTHEARGAGWA